MIYARSSAKRGLVDDLATRSAGNEGIFGATDLATRSVGCEGIFGATDLATRSAGNEGIFGARDLATTSAGCGCIALYEPLFGVFL